MNDLEKQASELVKKTVEKDKIERIAEEICHIANFKQAIEETNKQIKSSEETIKDLVAGKEKVHYPYIISLLRKSEGQK